jgi:hypothetical protein
MQITEMYIKILINALKVVIQTALTLALTINDRGIPENFDYIGS